jgi:hypothetical protein
MIVEFVIITEFKSNIFYSYFKVMVTRSTAGTFTLFNLLRKYKVKISLVFA